MCKVTVESQVGLMDVQGLIFSWKTVRIGNKLELTAQKFHTAKFKYKQQKQKTCHCYGTG